MQEQPQNFETFAEISFLTSLLSPLLSFPGELHVTRTQDERGVLLTVAVADEDMGRAIGKLGATANAIRHLLRQYGSIHKSMISLKILDPHQSSKVAEPVGAETY